MAPRQRALPDLVSVTKISNKRAKGMLPTTISALRAVRNFYTRAIGIVQIAIVYRDTAPGERL